MSSEKSIPTDILELLNFYNIEYKQVGSVYMAHCIFHNGDNTPSMAIYPETNTVFCFGCLTGGTIETIVMKMENCSYSEAVKLIYGEGYEWKRLQKNTKTEPSVDEIYLYNIIGRNLRAEIHKSVDNKEKLDKLRNLILKYSKAKVKANELFKTLREIKEAK
jgi:hypothetical protein